ncbi:MAG: hypothetical protein HYS13_21420 [Planctomycetia bacterium]|nr:hypothetical protein [Planctomycetia bacterium]
MLPRAIVLLTAIGASWAISPAYCQEPQNARRPADEAELKFWLQNMAWRHRFTMDEMRQATGMEEAELAAALKKFDIRDDNRPHRKGDDPLLVLPYPGGRHPRIGFLDGAVDPQRETKVSVFAPWGETDYVVVDVPEAVWSNLGLTYLAHTHVPTIWSKQGIRLERMEWNRRKDGGFDLLRKLPNGIEIGSEVVPGKEGVRLKLTLKNGAEVALSDLRVQMCAMLKGMNGFTEQTTDNKVLTKPYCACRDESGKRWVITAWEPCHRPWANKLCPCLHSDPKFPDCPPGQTVTVRGWLSFYEGADVEGEFKRLEKIGWKDDKKQ